MAETIDVPFLLSQRKIVITKDGRSLKEVLDFNKNHSYRYYMALEQDLAEDIKFFLEITRSSKRSVQLTLHFQDKTSNICLIRIDFNPGAQHTNPPLSNNGTDVPPELTQFAGKKISGSHVHYYVDGYKPAVWAMPLENTDFEVKDFDENDFVNSFNNIMKAFSLKINLVTEIRHIDVLPI